MTAAGGNDAKFWWASWVLLAVGVGMVLAAVFLPLLLLPQFTVLPSVHD